MSEIKTINGLPVVASYPMRDRLSMKPGCRIVLVKQDDRMWVVAYHVAGANHWISGDYYDNETEAYKDFLSRCAREGLHNENA